VAAIVGDNLGYRSARHGARLLEAQGPLEHHRRSIIVKAKPFFERHGPKAVFLGPLGGGPADRRRLARPASPTCAGASLFSGTARRHRLATSVGLVAYLLGPGAKKNSRGPPASRDRPGPPRRVAYGVWWYRRRRGHGRTARPTPAAPPESRRTGRG